MPLTERNCVVCNNLFKPRCDYHRNKNTIIRFEWSRGVNGRETWRKAEEQVAVQILLLEGFMEVMSLKPFKHNFYFDIRAINNITNRVCVFQVTPTNS